MIVEDRSRIKKIHILYPDVLSPDADKVILEKILYLKELKEKSLEYFRLKELTDKEIKEKSSELSTLDKLYEIEYETKEVDDNKSSGDCFMIVESNGTIHG